MKFENREFGIIGYNKNYGPPCYKTEDLYQTLARCMCVCVGVCSGYITSLFLLSLRILCVYFRTLPFDKLVQRAAEEKTMNSLFQR